MRPARTTTSRSIRLRVAHLVRRHLSWSRKQGHLELLMCMFLHRADTSF
ncbi:hypothetical protein J2Y00_000002 [Deinococcus soli (ex Cha et al. 2016)]|jgi:hypothetical protein|uniref:Uncharacterized protein n=2 Tax=Deinococcus soli (ex Cha et al. 2016) TaxID=1309411 RepID=A0ACC6KAP0_9DEIO|nr:hypothetical protein [Deinococcus soli (ex Cha et al. 2016)]MDR6327274.1 hypothetical protein [Deinococcus soli (ex Cha et al. 2016)]MDR6749549.1 hypothetical protein [Deinococcus soli (ex Cha et al. 2016)]